MTGLNELKEVKIHLPAYLIDLFKSQAEYKERSFTDELVNVLEKAIFLDLGDLTLIKEAAEAKAEPDAIREASAEEGVMLLRKVRERKQVIDGISRLKPAGE
jgi:hypothetical protein